MVESSCCNYLWTISTGNRVKGILVVTFALWRIRKTWINFKKVWLEEPYQVCETKYITYGLLLPVNGRYTAAGGRERLASHLEVGTTRLGNPRAATTGNRWYAPMPCIKSVKPERSVPRFYMRFATHNAMRFLARRLLVVNKHVHK